MKRQERDLQKLIIATSGIPSEFQGRIAPRISEYKSNILKLKESLNILLLIDSKPLPESFIIKGCFGSDDDTFICDHSNSIMDYVAEKRWCPKCGYI